mmetsp:Transcript_79256/g.211982  ORF Transcript_79256/g.211982 Transcript_79256/m.211982 type:complete len:81 (-) Transcript_79256:95-337(-)
MTALRAALRAVPRARPATGFRMFSQSRPQGPSGKAAPPETPLAFYQATAHATSSINHRMFYVNWILMVAVVDMFNGVVDY